MMRKPYFWIWIVCVVMRVVPLQAADEQPGGMLDQTTVIQAAKTVTSKQYPNADSVLVDEFIRVKYEADGTSETWDDEYVKVLTENAAKARALIKALSPRLGSRDKPCAEGCHHSLETALITAPEARDPALMAKLDAVAGRLLAPKD